MSRRRVEVSGCDYKWEGAAEKALPYGRPDPYRFRVEVNQLRVLEVAGRLSTALAGRLLAAAGAHVVRVQLRHDAARAAASWGLARPRVAEFSAMSARPAPGGVVRVDKCEELFELSQAADIVITSSDSGEVDQQILEQSLAAQVLIHVSPYGIGGARQKLLADDFTLMAHAGITAYVGDTDRPPLNPPIRIPSHQTGAWVALIALAAGGSSESGCTLDLAEFDITVVTNAAGGITDAALKRTIAARSGRRRPGPYPYTHLRCADGVLCVAFLRGRQWAKFLDLLGRPAWSEAREFGDRTEMGVRHFRRLDSLLERELSTWTTEEIVSEARRRRLPLCEVRTVATFDRTREWRDRLAPDGPGTSAPPADISAPYSIRPIAAGSSLSRSRPRSVVRAAHGFQPMNGIRVLDLGAVFSAPMIGRILSTLGADVVKVEHPTRIDSSRRGPAHIHGSEGVAEHDLLRGTFANVNLGKRSVSVDLLVERDRFLALVGAADVVVENFGPDGLERLDLGESALFDVNPQLVLARVSLGGQTSPDAGRVGYAPHATALAGLDSLCRYPADADAIGMVGLNLGDTSAALFGALGVIDALQRRAVGGIGGAVVDVSMVESAAVYLEARLDPARVQPAETNRGFPAGPEIVQCLDGNWIAVSFDDPCSIQGVSDLAPATGLTSLPARVRSWARRRSATDAVEILRQAGVAASPVWEMRHLAADAELRTRGAVVEIGAAAPYPVVATCLGANGSRRDNVFGWPRLGAHTEEVFAQWLSLEDSVVRGQSPGYAPIAGNS